MIDGDPNGLSGRSTSDERFGRPRRSAAQTPLRRRAGDLVRLVKDVDDEPKPRAVHLLRTTIRRVETLLPDEAGATQPERKLRKQLDRVRRRAGKVRDVDVHLRALRSLRLAASDDACTELRRALEKARAKREKRLARVLDDLRDRGIVKRIRQVVARADVAPEPTGAAAERVLADVVGGFERAWQAAQPLGDEALHELRIETKRLRYRGETIPSSLVAARVTADLKRVQDAIGTWHDWLTLCQRAEEELGDGGEPLLATLRARSVDARAKAIAVTERVGRRLQKLRPAAARKGVRPMTGVSASVPRPSASARA